MQILKNWTISPIVSRLPLFGDGGRWEKFTRKHNGQKHFKYMMKNFSDIFVNPMKKFLKYMCKRDRKVLFKSEIVLKIFNLIFTVQRDELYTGKNLLDLNEATFRIKLKGLFVKEYQEIAKPLLRRFCIDTWNYIWCLIYGAL